MLMPGQRGTEIRCMGETFTIRMPSELARRSRAAADARGLSVAAWLRGLAAEAVGVEEADRGPVTPRRPTYPEPPQAIRLLVQIADRLATLNEGLIGLAGKADQRADPVAASELRQALSETRAASAAVIAMITKLRRL